MSSIQGASSLELYGCCCYLRFAWAVVWSGVRGWTISICRVTCLSIFNPQGARRPAKCSRHAGPFGWPEDLPLKSFHLAGRASLIDRVISA